MQFCPCSKILVSLKRRISMPKNAKAKTVLSDFDKIVQAQIRKSVVTAPSDPNGGAKLPKRQKDAPDRKRAGKTQYMAVFDRDADESDNQLDDWMEDTNDATQSPNHFVNDDDDTPVDPDDEDFEDNRGEGVYDPYGDDDDLDDDDLESLELPDDDDEYVTVRGHKRRKVKKSNAASRSDMDDEFSDLSDDDDDLDEGNDDDDDDEEGDDRPVNKNKTNDKRRKQVRKALGADAMKYVDGNEFIKSLTDAVFDMKDEFIAEVRALRLENKKLRQMIKSENRQMAKSLVAAQAQFAGYAPMETQQTSAQPIRKGYGMPVQTSQRAVPQEFNLAKALDVVEDAFQKGFDGITMRDLTILENDRHWANVSNAAQELLRKEKLI